jgi:hypothetical protein
VYHLHVDWLVDHSTLTHIIGEGLRRKNILKCDAEISEEFGRCFTIYLDFPKSEVRGSWKRRTFVTRKRTKFTGAFLLR